MKFRVWITYSLLVSFFVLVTPRTLWHNCEHPVHSHVTKNDDPHSVNHLEKKSCFACDFDLGLADQPTQIVSFFTPKKHVNRTNELISSIENSAFTLFNKRGPPTV